MLTEYADARRGSILTCQRSELYRKLVRLYFTPSVGLCHVKIMTDSIMIEFYISKHSSVVSTSLCREVLFASTRA